MLSIAEQKKLAETLKPEAARRKCTNIWVTKDGRAIEITAMEDSHLVSTMGLLARNAAYNAELQAFRAISYAENAPDGAAMAATSAAAGLMESTRAEIMQEAGQSFPALVNMEKEANKRSLAWHDVVDNKIKMGRTMFLVKLTNALKNNAKKTRNVVFNKEAPGHNWDEIQP